MITLIQISVISFNNTTTNLAMLINPSRIVSVKSFASLTRLSYISKTDGYIDVIIINETFSSFKARTGDYNAGVTITLPIIALGDTTSTELLVDNLTSVIDNADIPGQSIIQYVEYNVLTQKDVVMTMADILALANSSAEPVKYPTRAATIGPINLASGPALIDTVALVVGDRVLVKDQGAGQDNGIYIWNGLGVPMTRSEDFKFSSEVFAGILVVNTEGMANVDTIFELITDNPIIIDTTPLVFAAVITVGGPVLTVSGTVNRITSTGGINPVIDISAGYVGQTSITTLGTITTATWNATTIGAIYGGTGQNTYAIGDMLYASGVNTLSKLAAGIDNQTLVLLGGVPTWQNYSLVPPLSAVLAAGNTTGANDISVNTGRKIFSNVATQTIDQVFSATDWYVDANDSATNKEGLLTVSSFDASVDLYSSDGANASHLTNYVDYGVITSDKATYQGYKYEALTSLAVGTNGNQYTIYDRRYNDLRYAAIGSFETLAQTMTAGRLADVTGTIYDSSNVLAIHIAAGLTIGSRILYDEVGTASVKWRERILWTSVDKAADWSSRDLFVVGGATSSLNWGTRTLSVGKWSYDANYTPFSGQQIPDAAWVAANFAPISVTNALTSTYIGYGSGANVLTGDTNLTWNAANQDLTAGGTVQLKLSNSNNTFWAAEGDAGFWYTGPTSTGLLAHRGFGIDLKTTEKYTMGDTQPGGIYFEVNKSALQYKLSTFTGGGTLMLTVDNTGIIGTAAVPAGGTVTSVSVVSANGFAGTVATATTTPAITLTTSISGVLKGSASALAAATSADITSFLLTGLVVSGGAIVAGDTILQAFGKTQSQINALLGGVNYQGVWNATTNIPALASGVGTKGYYYVVSVAGATNLDGITDWKLGDWAIFNGTTWDKVDNTDAVISVNGLTGVVGLTGTANRLSVSIANVFDIDAAYVGQTSITTLGTLTTGTWNASVIGAVYGGTSQSTYATGDTLYASGINALSKLAAGTVGQVLTMAGGVPTWATPTTGTVTTVSVVTNQGVSGSVANATTTPAITLTLGALTGVTSFNGLVITANTGAITTGSWAATTIGATVGGTGQSTYATGDTLYASAINTLSKLTIGTAGQVLTVVAGIPSWVTPGAGSGWSILGNAATVDGVNFLGTTDDIPLTFRVNNVTAGRITTATGAVFTTSFGYLAGNAWVAATNATAIGYNALTLSTGNSNTAVGSKAGAALVSGGSNTLVGTRVMDTGTGGSFNTMMGSLSGEAITGSNNTFYGYLTGNIATSAANNVLIGYQVGNALTTGANNIAIGYDIDLPTAGGSNQLTIGNTIFGTGINGADTTLSTGKIGILMNAPSVPFHIAGELRLGIVLGGLGGAVASNGILSFSNVANANIFSIQTGVTGSTFSWVLPNTQGAATQVLQNDGAGVLSWVANGGAGAISGSGTANTMTKWTGTSSIGNSLSTDDGTTTTIGGIAKLSGYFSNSTIVFDVTADQTNWSIGTASYFIANPTATRTIQGIVAPTASQMGTEITITNRNASFNLVFIQNSTTATATNRLFISSGADGATGLTLQPLQSVTFVYDFGFAGGARWRLKVMSTATTPNIDSLLQSSRMTSGVARVTTTTYTNATGLTATLIAGRKYKVEINYFITSTTTGGGKINLNGGTATITSMQGCVTIIETGPVLDAIALVTALADSNGSNVTSGASMHIKYEAALVCNAAGTLIPQFGQLSAAGTSTLLTNSVMMVTEII